VILGNVEIKETLRNYSLKVAVF